jgi:hypothetical protein
LPHSNSMGEKRLENKGRIKGPPYMILISTAEILALEFIRDSIPYNLCKNDPSL